MTGVSERSAMIARTVFNAARRVFHFDMKARHWKKFVIVRFEPSYLLFDPPHIGVREAYAVLRAFNLSIWL